MVKVALVVEDNLQLNRLYSKVLSQVGLQVFQAETCEQTFVWLAKVVPDLIFLDMTLPDGTGLSIAEHVRSNEGFERTRIVGVSGIDNSFVSMNRSLLDDYLHKPVSTVTLRETVKLLHLSE